MTVEVLARAKINLDLRVRSVDASGYHPLRSVVTTVAWEDRLEVAEAESDHLEISGSAAVPSVPDGGENLVVRALEAARRHQPDPRRWEMRLTKLIAAAAGLGGGSADAAAMLRAYGYLVGADVSACAPGLGADVPFLVSGGAGVIEGYGERITRLPAFGDFWVVIAVPDFELATAAVYRRWDELGEPVGPEVAGRSLPPSLRESQPLINDLYPSAVSLRPDLAEWRAELTDRWDRPVLLSGSGPALFGFFADEDEAESAARVTPAAARAVRAVRPTVEGTLVVDR